jgi:hypothetical protein
MPKARWSLLMIVILAIATGCGGGGDSGSTPAPTVAPNWGTAVLIESDNTGDAAYPQIAIDTTGNAIAVWEQFDGSRYNIKANRYVLNVGWGTPVTIESGSGDARNPRIAMDPNGNAIAVWEQFNGTRYSIFANRYTAGGSWGSAVAIDASSTGTSANPQIAMDSNGNAFAVWEQYDAAMTRDSIRANRYAVSGSAWGTEATIDSGGTGNTGASANPRVVVGSGGGAIAVWEQSAGGLSNIRANVYAGGWGTAELIETDNTGNAYFPKVAVDSSGNAIAVWEQFNGTRYSIRANRYSGSWGVAEVIDAGGSGNAGASGNAQVAMEPGGSAIAVWEQSDGSLISIRANRYSGGWGVAQLIETSGAGDAALPDVAMDGSGNAVAVWEQFDGSLNNILANRYSGAWIAAGLIETGNAGLAANARVAVNAGGRAVAVWEQYDGTRMSIYANRYN